MTTLSAEPEHLALWSVLWYSARKLISPYESVLNCCQRRIIVLAAALFPQGYIAVNGCGFFPAR